ncbi:MAG TPA: L-threonylcarbamoyladenylate synthase, partial [Phototrophicaceae bacterium]|nr:L-threonylcarbamoyladenylate synthase [Phototrophicaceae bacterium]
MRIVTILIMSPYSAETQVFHLNPDNLDQQIIETAAAVLHTGGLVAFPTETVYGLGANATDAEAVNRIFSAKGRPASDPVIVHLYDLAQLETVAIHVPELAYDLANQFWPGPLTLVLQRHPAIPPNVSAGMATVAVRMPQHPIALALFRATGLPVAAPSANRFARPSATTAAHVWDDLQGRVDIILDGGATQIGLESTILDLTKTTPAVLRPGGIPLEALRAVIPDVQLVSRHLQPDETGIEAPGMLLKHYSPRAELLLFTGDPEQVHSRMQTEAQARLRVGQRVGILTPDEEVPVFDGIPVVLFPLGAVNNLAQIGT